MPQICDINQDLLSNPTMNYIELITGKVDVDKTTIESALEDKKIFYQSVEMQGNSWLISVPKDTKALNLQTVKEFARVFGNPRPLLQIDNIFKVRL